MPEKIKIDANSWHYKLYRKTWNAEPANLCAYVRGILTSALVQTLKLIFILAVCAIFFALIAGCSWVFYENFKKEGWGMFLPLLMIIGAILSVILGLVGIVWIREEGPDIPDAFRKFFGGKIKKNRRASLIYEWLKAKKEKYCPLVEIQHTEKDKQA